MNGRQGRKPYTVLVIDDESDVRQLLEHLLDRDLFTVVTVESGRDGLARLQADDSPVDIIILDIAMPGMDGFQTLENVQALDTVPPTVVLSSRDSEDAQVRALELGAVDYVTKPFSTAVMVARLKRHLEREDDQPGSFRGPWISAADLVQ